MPTTASLPSEDPRLVEVLTRIETKLDTYAAHADDHESRIRDGEQDRADIRSELNSRVKYRDLWLGITGAIGAAAALSTIINALIPN